MIVFCHLLNDSSGSPRVLRSAIAALDSVGHGNLLYVDSGTRGLLEDCGLEIRRYWYQRGSRRIVTVFTYMASQGLLFLRLLRSHDIPRDAVVYVNTLLPFGAALWGRLTGRRVLYHVHEISVTPGVLRHLLVGIARRTASRILYVSESHRDGLPIPGVPAAVLVNPVDQALFNRAAATAYAPRRSGHFEALMLGSPRDFKGVPEFLQLARRFGRQPDVAFTLLLNAEADEVSSYLARHQVPANVMVLPRVSDPSPLYARADVVMNLSRVDLWIETFGLTLAEAMAFGLPVIAPPIGGPAEIVTDGVEGYLVDSRDPTALEAALGRLVESPELCRRMSAAARARASLFQWDHFAEQLRQEVARLGSDGSTA